MDPCCLRRRSTPPPPTSPIDGDDLLSEILIRLPRLPSSLRRASLVCKRWRRLVTDPQFLRRFRAHHREAPLVGVFLGLYGGELSFRPVLDPPDLIPPERLSARLEGGGEGDNWHFHGCRHGRALLINRSRDGRGCRQILVWDPVTGEQRFLIPQQFGHVLCADGDKGHVHGSCHSSPFKVVLVLADMYFEEAFTCVYSSETREWSNPISTGVLSETVIVVGSQNILVGDSLYWFLFGYQVSILEFDLNRQSLDIIEVPSDACANHHGLYLSTLAEGGGLGFIAISDDFRAQLWERTTDFDGVAGWMPGQTIELDKLLPLTPGPWTNLQTVMGHAADDNVIFVSTYSGVFMVHLKSMQFKKIFKRNPFADCTTSTIYPFASFCAASNSIATKV